MNVHPRFTLEAQDSRTRARAGTLLTTHGAIDTPVFMPVGTQATVRSQTATSLSAAGSRILLANTYHLMRRPGVEVFRKFGGIHRFMDWSGAVLTDSGGFQIFSLPHAREMSEEAARFTDEGGRAWVLTPEKSIEVQQAIGSDIMMALDECIDATSEFEAARAAMERTHRWALRSLQTRAVGEANGVPAQGLFGIVQGACHPELRRESAARLTDLSIAARSGGFDGLAIGGLAVGETRAEREDMTELVTGLLPRELPRYLMGVGTPIDLLEGVHRGVDMFDCILPTSFGQQGVAWTSQGRVDLRRGAYRMAEAPLDPDCQCPTCAHHSRAYLHHLIRASEVLGWTLVAGHNLWFYHALMRRMRQAILAGSFSSLYAELKPALEADDPEAPKTQPRAKRRKPLPPTRLGDYEIVSGRGHFAIRQISSGETMHSVNDPDTEARSLYVEQSRLAERLREDGPDLVIWDVGLGAATNAMAAIRAAEKLGAACARGLRVVSFERDLDPLKLASGHPVWFAHLRHGGPKSILEKGSWESARAPVRWELVEGDFQERMLEAPEPALVFFDPFSRKVDGKLWTVEAFSRLRERCPKAELYTYSGSTSVRAAMLAGGFFVGRGVPTGPKSETTIAFGAEVSDPRLLGAEWLERWRRSGARDPELDARILEHPQFSPHSTLNEASTESRSSLESVPG